MDAAVLRPLSRHIRSGSRAELNLGGSDGWVRSNAWHCFSSKLKTTARSGGLR